MAVPTTRQAFKDYCLRKLGAPVIRINVSDSQVEDRIDEGLSFWYDYAMDGSEKMYYKYQIQDADITNQYITLPENIIGATRIFDIGVISSAIANPFNLNYQIALNDLYTIASSSMIPYYTMMTQLELIEQMLVGQKPIRYNRMNNILYVDMDWTVFLAGQYLLVEAYQVIDPDVYTKAWSNRLLQNYCTALIKQNWSSNIGKMDTTLPGDVKINYQKIADEAEKEIAKWEQAIMDTNISDQMWTG